MEGTKASELTHSPGSGTTMMSPAATSAVVGKRPWVGADGERRRDDERAAARVEPPTPASSSSCASAAATGRRAGGRPRRAPHPRFLLLARGRRRRDDELAAVGWRALAARGGNGDWERWVGC